MTLADFEYDLVRPDLGKGVVCPACYADPHADEDLEPDLEPTHPASSQARSSISAMTPLSPTSSALATSAWMAPVAAPGSLQTEYPLDHEERRLPSFRFDCIRRGAFDGRADTVVGFRSTDGDLGEKMLASFTEDGPVRTDLGEGLYCPRCYNAEEGCLF